MAASSGDGNQLPSQENPPGVGSGGQAANTSQAAPPGGGRSHEEEIESSREEEIALGATVGAALRHLFGPGGSAGTFEIRRDVIEVKSFDPASCKTDADVTAAFEMFCASFLAYVEQSDLLEALEGPPIPVGVKGMQRSELFRNYNAEMVKKSSRLWAVLLTAIKDPSVWLRVDSTGSPQQGWQTLCREFSVRVSEAKEKYQDEWSDLRQKEDERLLEYYRRAETIRANFINAGGRLTDSEFTKRVARGLRDEFSTERSILLTNAVPLTRGQLEGVLRQVTSERNQRSGGEENEGTRHTLVVAGAGRNGDGGGTARGQLAVSRDRQVISSPSSAASSAASSRGEASRELYCHHHGYNTSHESRDCKVMQEIWEEFLQARYGPSPGGGGGGGVPPGFGNQSRKWRGNFPPHGHAFLSQQPGGYADAPEEGWVPSPWELQQYAQQQQQQQQWWNGGYGYGLAARGRVAAAAGGHDFVADSGMDPYTCWRKRMEGEH